MNEHETIDREAMEFAASLIQASSDSLQWTNTQLIEGYKHQAETAQATLDAVRDGINLLLSGPYAPSAVALERALWPHSDLIDQYRPTDRNEKREAARND